MKSNFINISVSRVSLVIATITVVFIIFFTSFTYKSSSAIDVTSNNSDSFASSFASSFISSSGSSNAFQLKLYLESNEASNILRDKYEIENFYVKDSISYFSKFRDSWYQDFHVYLQKKLNISVDSNSNTLVIETLAFSSEEAKILNLSLVDIISDFLNKKTRLAAAYSRSGSVCELYMADSGLIGLNLNGSQFESQTLVYEASTLNQLLTNKADNFKEYCINKLNNPSNVTGSKDNKSLNIPAFELRSINAEASKNILTQIYEDSMNIISEAKYIDVISEPVLAEKPESKLTFQIFILTYAITLIFLITIKISIRLADEFNT